MQERGQERPARQHHGQEAAFRLCTEKETMKSRNRHAAALALVGWYPRLVHEV